MTREALPALARRENVHWRVEALVSPLFSPSKTRGSDDRHTDQEPQEPGGSHSASCAKTRHCASSQSHLEPELVLITSSQDKWL